MSQAKIDHRPEGSLLLCAKMFGAWNEAVYLGEAAAEKDHAVDLVMTGRRGFPFHFQTIECSK